MDISPGPDFVTGNMETIPAGISGEVEPYYNQDAGPSCLFQGQFYPDVRYPFMKDKVQGYTGVVPGHLNHDYFVQTDAVPAAFGTATVAAAQTAAAGVAMTLASVQAAGITPGVPVRQQSPNPPYVVNGGTLINALCLDFGFAFGNCVAGNAQIAVADSTQFNVGEPLIIPGAGAGGGVLFTNVATIVDATHITVGTGTGASGLLGTLSGGIPLTANATAPIGTGNYWGPSEVGFPVPDAHLPYVACGPGLILDSRQSICRGLSVTGPSGGAGGTFAVVGLDIYGAIEHENIVVAAGSNTVYSKKCYKWVVSVTPQFTDATHNYSVGTSDLFGFAIRTDKYEYTTLFWAAQFVQQTQTNSGWSAGDLTNPPTATTKDVRGTFQTSAQGPGSGLQSQGANSNGSISSLAMSGNRLLISMCMPAFNIINTFPATPQFTYGLPPF